jgi:hypothetical protein
MSLSDVKGVRVVKSVFDSVQVRRSVCGGKTMKAISKFVLVAMVLGGAMFASAVALAQGPVPEATKEGNVGSDGVLYKKETVYDFDDDMVEGALVKPDGLRIQGEQHGKTSSLIKIRSDFVPEMIKSVEDL